MDVSDGYGVKHEADEKSDDKTDSKENDKAEGKRNSHLDDKKIDDDITAIYEKGVCMVLV